MIVCLAMWPLEPAFPLPESVARFYQALARYIRDERHNSHQQELDSAQLKQGVQLRPTLQTARHTLTLTRRGILGNSSIGELMVVLIQNVDRLIILVDSLIEFLEIHAHWPQLITVRILVDNALEQIPGVNFSLMRSLRDPRSGTGREKGDRDGRKAIVTLERRSG